MIGFGETYLVAFALAVGATGAFAGMIGVLPVVAGSLLQLIIPRLMAKYFTKRLWVIFWAFVQVTVFLITSILAYQEFRTTLVSWIILSLAGLYWTAAQSAGPVWNAWTASIVPQERHLRFFSYRTRTTQAATLVGLLAGGFTLRYFAKLEHPMLGFTVIFLAAACTRVVSTYFLASIPDGPVREVRKKSAIATHQPLGQWLKSSDMMPVLLFLFFTNFAAQTSAPFFSPFMLGPLNMSYGLYTVLISATFLARVGSATLFYRFARRFRVGGLALLGAISVIPLPYLWTLSQNPYYLLLIQFGSGFAWGAHELGVTLYLIERIPHDERARLLSIANVSNAIGMLCGSCIGAWLITQGLGSPRAYFAAFTWSSILRFIPLAFVFLWGGRDGLLQRIWRREINIGPLAVPEEAAAAESLIDKNAS